MPPRRSPKGIRLTAVYTPDVQRSAQALIKVLQASNQHDAAADQERERDTFLFTTEAAQLLGLAPSSVRGAAQRGALLGQKSMGWWAFQKADVLAFAAKRQERPWPGNWRREG